MFCITGLLLLFRNELNYTTLKNELSATDGNISFHLKKLEKA